MSVTATYIRLAESALDDLRRDPDWIATVDRRKVLGAEAINIDKACDGISWLLSRIPSPLPPISGGGFVMRRSLAHLVSGAGGREEPELDAGYGPAKLVSPAEVTELSAWLQSIDEAELRTAYDPKAMATDDVYPQIWMTHRESAFEEYLLPHFRALRGLVIEAARSSQALIVCFT